MFGKCPKGHNQQWKCLKGQPASCSQCDHEEKIAEKKRQEEIALQEKRNEEQRLYAQRLAELEQKEKRLGSVQPSSCPNVFTSKRKHANFGTLTVIECGGNP